MIINNNKISIIFSMWLVLVISLYTVHHIQCRVTDSTHRNNKHSALNHMDFMYHYKDKHPCQRECIAGSEPMTCQYVFHIEWYYTMSKACYDCPYNITDCDRPHCIPADGMKRAITVVNRQLPGPAVEVCAGDHVIVDLQNGLMEESSSIHWHGHHQVDSPYMDGVPHLTQCPVPPRTTFRYRFQADSPGTHFWHSHTGSQRGDGAFGSFIIRKPLIKEVHSHIYDYDLPEHTMLMTDWSHMLGVEMFNAHHHSDGDNKPPTILMNGKGVFREFPLDDGSDEVTYTPVEVFTVKQGHSYRFRIINAGYLNCPIELSIDNHTLTAISSDGGDIQPITVGSIVSYAGERWDFILNATHDISSYWIKMRGLMDCDERFTSAFQVAILKYEGATDEGPVGDVDYDATRTTGTVLNPLNTPSRQHNSTLISELSTVESAANDTRLRIQPDVKFYVSYDFYEIDNPHFHLSTLYGFYEVKNRTQQVRTPQLNHLSFKFPSFPLLSQRDQIDESTFCSHLNTEGCSSSYCECTNVVPVALHSVVELIIIDEGVAYDANHPFHLHGHPFRVVAMERVGKTITRQQVIDMDAKGLIHRNLETAPLKDTVTVPDGGFTIIRFQANNPGYWLFHCHIEFHVETGMALVFKVGEHEDMAPVPKGFPRCNNYFNPDGHPEDNEIQLVKQRIAPKSEASSSTTQDISEKLETTQHIEHTEVYNTIINKTHQLAHNSSTAHNKHAPSVYEEDLTKENTNIQGNSLNTVPPTSVYKVLDPKSENGEDNNLHPILFEDIDNFHPISIKKDSDTKETNDISNLSRWFRRSTPTESENGSIMMRPASLMLAATSIVIFIAAIAFAMYKACS